MYTRKIIGINEAWFIAESILKEASKDPDFPIAIAIADSSGDIVFFVKQDNASPNAFNMATKKAFTAARLRKSTGEIHGYYRSLNAEWFTGVRDCGDTNYVPFPGGVCIKDGEGKVIGAIGVTGRSNYRPRPSDVYLAELGVKAFEEYMRKSV